MRNRLVLLSSLALLFLVAGTLLAQVPNPLPSQSSIQFLMLGITGFLLLALLGVIKTLWGVRQPAFSFLRSYLQSEDGRAAIAGVLRDYLSLPEGKLFMEGVINGKIRAEVAEHNLAKEAHFGLQKDFATLNELNRAIASIRDDRGSISEAVCKSLEAKFDELSRSIKGS